MVKHVILWKLKDEFSDEQKEEIKAGIKAGLESLTGKIPGLLRIRVNTRSLASSNADVMLDSSFVDEASLKGYSTHPEHVKVADSKVRPFTKVRYCLDYVVDDEETDHEADHEEENKKAERKLAENGVNYDLTDRSMDFLRESAAQNLWGEGGYTLDDYYALPDERRVELIDGVIYDMASPSLNHQRVSMEVSTAFYNFIKSKKGGCEVFAAPMDVQLDCDNKTMVQPDVFVVCDPDKLQERCVYGAPDFVMEILSRSTRTKDMEIKTAKYARAGVREYWMVDVKKERVITFFFENETGPTIWSLDQEIPVRIFAGELKIRIRDML